MQCATVLFKTEQFVKRKREILTLTMVRLNISCFENSLDPDWLISEKQLIRIYTAFHSASEFIVETEIMQHKWLKIGEDSSVMKYLAW